jgi:hypothetical protein
LHSPECRIVLLTGCGLSLKPLMKRLVPGVVILVLWLPVAALSADTVAGEMVYRRTYADLNIPLSVVNAGIFGIEGFELVPGGYRIVRSDSAGPSIQSKRIYVPAGIVTLSGREGTLLAEDRENGTVALQGRHGVSIHLPRLDLPVSFAFEIQEDIAYADIIGVDARGNIALLVEMYEQEVPLRIRRDIIRLSPDGRILLRFTVPMVKYLTTAKDFDLDAEGRVYQLLSDRQGVTIVRWSTQSAHAPFAAELSSSLSEPLHFNDIVPVAEAVCGVPATPTAVSSRSLALRIAESYVVARYACSEANLSPSDVVAPDGDVVRTPGWLVAGPNARVPYKWGGFSTLAQYTAGLVAGKYAGDINTAGVSSSAVGVDCSGYVSRCWQLNTHYSTSEMPSITTAYASWDDLKPGDAIHKIGHVRLFLERTSNGALRVAEAAGRDWSVNYWTYLPSDLVGYAPRSYVGMGDDYCTVKPLLRSVLPEANGLARVRWEADTTGVSGFRLYGSLDGTTWSLMKDESELRTTSTLVPRLSGGQYFRVAAVSSQSAQGESNWSNALGIAGDADVADVLIVDGFERETGSFRAPGSLFAVRYGTALTQAGKTFHSVRNAEVSTGTVDLSSYPVVIWTVGDEGTATESLSETEQSLVSVYLEQGGSLFLSGSEIGYDLYEKGTAVDRDFYTQMLKSSYRADDAGSRSVSGPPGGIFAGLTFTIGQLYDEDYPDIIEPVSGGAQCLAYDSHAGAGISYSGIFGSGPIPGKLIYLGFPLETTADDRAFNDVIARALVFFWNPATAVENRRIPEELSLNQNYPNPFNPATTIRFSVAKPGLALLRVFDLLGREVSVLLRERIESGVHHAHFDASRLAGGVYFYRLETDQGIVTKRMTLVR